MDTAADRRWNKSFCWTRKNLRGDIIKGMALKDEILRYLEEHPGATDTELEKAFAKNHQHINITCRGLAEKGMIIRRKNPDKGNYIGNFLMKVETASPAEKEHTMMDDCVLQEEDLKHLLYAYLIKEGWSVEVAWGHNPGVDIDARKDGKRWLIEVKGPGSRQPMRVNYFIGILGEILQRMDDPDARYSIALPDMKQYRGLWKRLPQLAKERTTIDMLLIDVKGNITVYQ